MLRRNSFADRWFRFCFLIGVLVACLHPSPSGAHEAVTVTRITEDNAHSLLSDSPDRTGGIGDWYLANQHVWAIIDDIGNDNLISPTGGSLIDFGLTEGTHEQFVQMLQILNMNRDIVIPYDVVECVSDHEGAAIRIAASHGLRPQSAGFGVPDRATAEKVIVETQYRLNAGEQFLRVKTTVTNNSARKVRIFNVADIIYWGDDTIKPFAGSQFRLGSARGTPRGFQHPDVDTSSFLSLLRAMGGYTWVAGGGVAGLAPVSYGLCSPPEYGKNSLLWGINDRMVSAIGVFTGNFTRSTDVWKIALMGLEAGEEFVYERFLVAGERNDVASATDRIFPLLAQADGSMGVTGRITPPDAPTSIIIFEKHTNCALTQIRPDREGSTAGYFKAILPPGEYVAKIHSEQRDANLGTAAVDAVEKSFVVANAFVDVGDIELPPQATLLVEVRERDLPVPARVIVRGIEGTPDPELGADLLEFTVGGNATPCSFGANWLVLSGAEIEPVRVGLRPGRYELLATHGFEYSVDRKEIRLENAGSQQQVTLNLERLIETPGMMTGDFHVHSIASMDSAFSQEQRIVSAVADGVELVIATDHDAITDYAPAISALGLSDRISSIAGVEATSMLMLEATPFTIGHYNAWPLKFDATRPRNGMVLDEGLRPRMLYERLREIADGEALIQVNHGRGREPDGGASYFHALGTDFEKPLSYNPSKPMAEFPNSRLLEKTPGGSRDIDFDAMELLNGTAYDEYLLLKDDWFSLLNQGYNKTATANSDTHVKAQLAGYPRNYILLENPKAERASQQTLIGQIRNQRLFGTTGPIVEVTVDKLARPGDLVTPLANNVILNIKISAAPWIPLDYVRIYANGRQKEEFPITDGAGIVRFNQDVPLKFDRDTWLVVETATANANDNPIPQPPGGLYNIIAPDFVPLAFSNPIFVDIDGNGMFNPPGIPPTPTASAPPWTIKASIVAAFFLLISTVGHVRRRRTHP